ncbi:hypothetical protein B296_00008899 [Ensete ventricosum]|uniref:Uncharacterized protein n=1 Tax=Ensete ventricosum TaxID=4639 RepID=A0A426YFJ8_ENSVE|nr:hypothetical protein B296_00008899 [Ensete ventricosum]
MKAFVGGVVKRRYVSGVVPIPPSLLVAPYKEQQFRRAIPIKFFFACLSFGIALLAFSGGIHMQHLLANLRRTEIGDEEGLDYTPRLPYRVLPLSLLSWLLFSSIFRFSLALTQFSLYALRSLTIGSHALCEL